nr:P1 protein [Potato virus Y]
MAIYMPTICFGSIECKLPYSPASCEHVTEERKVLASVDPFVNLEAQLSARLLRQKHATVRVLKNGTRAYRYKTDAQIVRTQKKLERKERDEYHFQMAAPSIVSKITIAGGDPPSKFEPQMPKGIIHTTPRVRKVKTHSITKLTESQMNHLIKQVKRIMSDKKGSVHLINKKSTHVQYKEILGTTRATVRTAHMMGLRRRVDFRCDMWTIECFECLARTDKWSNQVHTINIRKGDSGVILNTDSLKGYFGRIAGGLFIVRGSHEGKLYDARSKVTQGVINSMVQF